MAAIRTQREIRQRAPIWLVMLLFANLAIMAFNARDTTTKQRMFRVWIQAAASPAQTITSKASSTGSNLIKQIVNFRRSAVEN